MIRISKVTFADMGHISTLEIATQEFPILIDELKPYWSEEIKRVYRAEIGDRTVGYVLLTLDVFKSVVMIDNIGVLPDFRKVGVGRRLIQESELVARIEGATKLRMLVASYLIEDKKDPWNIEHWLWRMEFMAVSVKNRNVHRYGKWHDDYIFERQVNDEKEASCSLATENSLPIEDSRSA